MNNNVWQEINEEVIWQDNAQSDDNGLIWRKPNGVWVMLIGDPTQTNKVMLVQVRYNPFTGEELQ